jgi:multicomponent Na+:H+ antiporter subunit G
VTTLDVAAAVLATAGTAFFVAGTIGLIRFPDVYTRLHALTKADNLGLGLVVIAALLRNPGWGSAFRLAVIWVLVLLASALASHLVAREALRRGLTPWRRP